MRPEKIDTPWNAERLSDFVKNKLQNRSLFVISNREPYTHTKENGETRWSVPVGGVVTALDPVMRTCGGTWIAHGSGNADQESADEHGKIAVPPDQQKYTLKRIWLSEQEVKNYYEGFSNEALWPLSHMAHTRPIFRVEDWDGYRAVNAKFASALLDEIKNIERPVVLVQDYHLALVPALIKEARPDAQIALFWHIPWPPPALFSICPWRTEILRGILGADLVGFHTQQYCNNFLETIASEIESRIDYEHFSIICGGQTTFVRPFPISIVFPESSAAPPALDRSVLINLNIKTPRLILGVDRLDYTKGILERFKAVEFLMENYPQYRGLVALLQIAAPTRESVEKYREYAKQVSEDAERINAKYGNESWKPIVFEKKHYSHESLNNLYRLSDVCLITSLHDGMNLVAKEYVAARFDEDGTLVLSEFTGASRDLKGAMLINPYSAEETSDAIHHALSMPRSERRRRMRTMRQSIRDYNIFRWSAEILQALLRIE